MRTVLAVGHDGMGHGDPALGQKILTTFLRKSVALRELSAVLLFNSGVKLAAAGSPALTELHQLHEHEVDVRPCGTCVDHFGLRDQIVVGTVSNMDEIITEMNRAAKVITL